MKAAANSYLFFAYFIRFFQNKKLRLKKPLISPWTTIGIMKSSKEKQKPYNKVH